MWQTDRQVDVARERNALTRTRTSNDSHKAYLHSVRPVLYNCIIRQRQDDLRIRVITTHDVKRLFVGIAIDVKWSEMFSDSRSGECNDAGRPRALVHRVLLRTEHIQILLVEQAISFAPSSGRRSGSDFLIDPSLAGAGSWLHFRRRNGVA